MPIEIKIFITCLIVWVGSMITIIEIRPDSYTFIDIILKICLSGSLFIMAATILYSIWRF